MKWLPTLPCGPMVSEWKKLCRLCLINFLASARASWSLVTDVGPSARSVHAGAWDSSRQRFWVHAGAGERLLKDLWVFDATTNAWTLITAVHPWESQFGPSERKDHVAVWDPSGALWIHGGFDGTNFVKDLWKYSDNWTMIAGNSVAGPCARSEHVAVWDSIHSVLWIHGGYDGNLKSDLWKFDSDWSLIPQTSSVPSARAQHVAVWDDARLAIWLHGGYDEHGLCRDLWRFDTAAHQWSLVAVDGPTARAYHVAAWDPTKLALWIHGGFDGMACEDLWRFDTTSSTWVLIHQGGPSARFNHIAAWDVTSASFWLHGGYVENGPLRSDLWRFDVTSTTTSMSTSSTSSSSVTTSSSTSTGSTSSTTATSSSSSSGTATTTTTLSSSSTSGTSSRSTTSATVTRTTSSTISQSATSSTSSTTITSSSTHSTTSTQTSTSTSTSSTSATVTRTSTSTISHSTSSSSSTRTTTSSSTLSTTGTKTSTGTSTSSTSATVTTTTSTTISQSTSSSTRSRTTTSSSTLSTTSTQTSTATSTSSTSVTVTTTTSTTISQSTSSSTRSRTTTSSSTLSTTSTQTSTGTSTSSTGTVSTSSTFSITESTSTYTTSSKTQSTATTFTSTSTLGSLGAEEDWTLLMILCPIMGVLVLGLSIMVVLMACWAKRRLRFMIPALPAPPAPPAPPPCPPPEPPTVWSLCMVTNTQLLQAPPCSSRIARILHHFDPWPLGCLNLPDLTTCTGEVHPRHRELHLPEAPPPEAEVPLHLCIDIDPIDLPPAKASGRASPQSTRPALTVHPPRRASPTQSAPALQTPATVAVASKTWLPGSGAVRHAASFRAAQKPPRLQRHVVLVEPCFVDLPKQVERWQNGQNGQRAVWNVSVVSVQPSPLLNVRSPTTEAPSVQRSSAFREQERLQCKCFLHRGQPAQTQTLTIFSLPNLPMATSGASETVERQLPLSEFLPEAPVNNQYRVPHSSVPVLQLAQKQDNRSRHSVASPDLFGKRLISLASASSSMTVPQICPDPTCLGQRPAEPQWPKSQRPRLPRGITAPPVLQTPAESLGRKGAGKGAKGSRGQRLRGQRTTSVRERAFYIPSLESER